MDCWPNIDSEAPEPPPEPAKKEMVKGNVQELEGGKGSATFRSVE